MLNDKRWWLDVLIDAYPKFRGPDLKQRYLTYDKAGKSWVLIQRKLFCSGGSEIVDDILLWWLERTWVNSQLTQRDRRILYVNPLTLAFFPLKLRQLKFSRGFQMEMSIKVGTFIWGILMVSDGSEFQIWVSLISCMVLDKLLNSLSMSSYIKWRELFRMNKRRLLILDKRIV